MNFLYQAAHSVLSSNPSQPQLARFYIHTLKTISKRLVLKIDPTIKRTICKSCDTLLVPGVTCTHRIRAAREKHLVVKCLTCGTLKRFLARGKHQLTWEEMEEEREEERKVATTSTPAQPTPPTP